MSRIRQAILSFPLALWCPLVVAAAPVAGDVDGFEVRVEPFFKQHCVQCHGPSESKGDLRLHALNGDFSSSESLEQWELILEMLEMGEMPPADEPQPNEDEVDAVVGWIKSKMRDFVDKSPVSNAAPRTRRLTNIEYQHTLSELIGFEFDVLDDLPEDPEHHYHFKNTAELMRIGPEQLDRYLEIAREAMKAAIVDPQQPEVFRIKREWKPHGIDRGMALDEVGVWGNRRGSPANGISLKGFPENGEFRIRMQASAILPPGFEEAPLKIDLGTAPGRTETPFKTVAKVLIKNSPDEPKVYEFTGRIENHPTALAPVGKRGPLVEQMTLIPRLDYDDGKLNDYYGNSAQLQYPRVVIQWIEFETPVVDVWPPQHHTAILFESPLRDSDERAYVAEVLKKFMSRAYRRPASQAEVERFAKIYDLIRPNTETLEDAVRETLAMVLISPQFLFHTESAPTTDPQYALASRLSYFLWANMPDAELLELAAGRKLSDPVVIKQQVLRMLADNKSHAFVEDFTLQWLSIGKMLTVPINKDLYPRFLYLVDRGETAGTEVPYRTTVRDYMMAETVGFIAELIRRNASVLNIVDSDFAYLNERLAMHYGVEGVNGTTLRAVPIQPEQNLGGLLTQGSVLIGNGTGTAPHPIYRAVWLREAILGDAVAPPPSEVPALTDTAGESLEHALSIADLLAKHRTVESCNDCHFRLDPWGIPFEEYNAIGRFQPKVPKDGTRVRGLQFLKQETYDSYQTYLDSINTVQVDATARVPHGPKVSGVQELKMHLLRERKNDVVTNVVRRLLEYGLGRQLTYRDRFAIEDLVGQAADNEYKMRDIIVSICLSDVFRDATEEKED